MKKLSVLLATTPALFVAGVALAAPPTGFGGFGNFAVDGPNGGTVEFDYDGAGATCPAGYTCSTLAATGRGISQRKVTLVDRVAAGIEDGSGGLVAGATDVAEGTSFIHTVVVEEDETIGGGNIVNSIGFMNESFVGAENNSNTIATLGTVELTGIGSGGGRTTAELSRGALLQSDEPTGIRVDQVNTAGGMTADFTLLYNSGASKYQRMDQIMGNGAANGGNMTVRLATGDYTQGPGTIEMPDGTEIDYDDGDALHVVFLRLQNFGIGAGSDRQLEVQSVRHAPTAGGVFGATPQTWTSHAGAGVFNSVVDSTTPVDWEFWDVNFGDAPQVSTAANGSVSTTFP